MLVTLVVSVINSAGLGNNLNSSLSCGQEVLKFFLVWASLGMFTFCFIYLADDLPEFLPKRIDREWKVTSLTEKSISSGQPDGTYFEPCSETLLTLVTCNTM